jgi:hypothetical protein
MDSFATAEIEGSGAAQQMVLEALHSAIAGSS